MESRIAHAAGLPDRAGAGGVRAGNAGLGTIASGSLDRASLLGAVLGGFGFFALACLSMWLAPMGDTLTAVWLPNAIVTVLLLRARVANEWPLLAAVLIGGCAAYGIAGQAWPVALLLAGAHVVEVVVVSAIVRAPGTGVPDMRRLGDLARLVWAGGLVAPFASAILAAATMGPGLDAIRIGGTVWFLTNSMAMILLVPALLLMLDRSRDGYGQAEASGFESAALMLGGMTCTYLVFAQPHYPLTFLILPITLLHAFRLGSLGTAFHVVFVAGVGGAMTLSGHGPIAAATAPGISQMHLIQAFFAANFLTGLPVAAILAGRDWMTAQIEAGKHELDLLADNISDAVLRFDMDGTCTYASPSVTVVMGRASESFVGRPVTERLHPDARDRITHAIDRLLGATSERERLTYRRYEDDAEGNAVFLEADAVIVTNPDTGEREGVVVAARDVTDRVELEQLLTRARLTAENAARAKSDFLANMSHEIRTPMNGVLGFAELMLQGELDPQQRRYIEMIVQSGRSMMMLLNDVLDLSKIESGQFSIDLAPVDLHATLHECAALHRLSAECKGLSLLFDEPMAGDRPWIVTDGLRLRQIVLNLIGNAVKFTQNGEVELACTIAADEVRVVVRDTGIGIASDRLETIFQPFTQAESDTARRFGGTGLGLSISHQLARLLGGRIEVTSTPGAGSCFTLAFPAAVARNETPREAPPLTEAPAMPGPSATTLPQAARILLAEDHDINRLLMCDMLERCGQTVDVAHDGNEAIAMVIDSIMRGSPYDLVLMDVQMPDCDGYAATRAIRAEGIGPGELAIIALTANAFPEDIAAARAAGMQAHLAKPIIFAELARALQRWLPTRIVESREGSAADRRAPRPGAIAPSPRLVQQWQTRRAEAIAAVAAHLADQLDGVPANDARDADTLVSLLHKLAGSAALFDEPDLGESARALERAIRQGLSCDVQEALAREVLALAERPLAPFERAEMTRR